MTYLIQSNTPVLDSLQTTAFCTEESKTNMTRPYFKKTDILREWEHLANEIQSKQMQRHQCHKQTKVQTSSYLLHEQTLETTSTWPSPSAATSTGAPILRM